MTICTGGRDCTRRPAPHAPAAQLGNADADRLAPVRHDECERAGEQRSHALRGAPGTRSSSMTTSGNSNAIGIPSGRPFSR